MPTRPVGVTDTADAAGIAPVDVLERPAPDLTTTTTADPGAGGTTLAVTNGSLKFPATNGFKVDVEGERMLVTAGAASNSWTVTRGVDGTTAVAHTIGVVVSMVVGVQRVIPVSDRVLLWSGMASSFRTPGRAATAQNIFSIFNAAGSTVLVAVKRISLIPDQTVVRLTVSPLVKTARSTVLPTNGTALSKVAFDTAMVDSASVSVLGDAQSDGSGSTTTLTSTPAAAKAWAAQIDRVNTLVGQQIYDERPCIPQLCEADPIILRASEGLLVHIVAAAATDNPATAHYTINCMFEQYRVA